MQFRVCRVCILICSIFLKKFIDIIFMIFIQKKLSKFNLIFKLKYFNVLMKFKIKYNNNIIILFNNIVTIRVINIFFISIYVLNILKKKKLKFFNKKI